MYCGSINNQSCIHRHIIKATIHCIYTSLPYQTKPTWSTHIYWCIYNHSRQTDIWRNRSHNPIYQYSEWSIDSHIMMWCAKRYQNTAQYSSPRSVLPWYCCIVCYCFLIRFHQLCMCSFNGSWELYQISIFFWSLFVLIIIIIIIYIYIYIYTMLSSYHMFVQLLLSFFKAIRLNSYSGGYLFLKSFYYVLLNISKHYVVIYGDFSMFVIALNVKYYRTIILLCTYYPSQCANCISLLSLVQPLVSFKINNIYLLPASLFKMWRSPYPWACWVERPLL